MGKREENRMFNILAKPVNQALIVAPDKVDDFLNEKADPKVKERILRNCERLKQQRIENERKSK